jgi:hypothetical protein
MKMKLVYVPPPPVLANYRRCVDSKCYSDYENAFVLSVPAYCGKPSIKE